MADGSGRVDPPAGGEAADEGGDPTTPPPTRKRKWDWRTDSRNEPIGIVGISSLADENRPQGAIGPPEVEIPPADPFTYDELAFLAEAESDRSPVPHAELFSRSPRPSRREARSGSGGPSPRSRRVRLGLIGTVALLALAATLYATLGSSPAHKTASNSTTSTTAKTTTTVTHHTTTTVTHHTTVTVNPKVVSLYRSLARVMDAANVLLGAQLNSSGSTPTLAEASADITPYGTDVKNYEYELHYLAWPSRMDPAVQDLYGKLETYNEFLQTFSSTKTSTLAHWLTELRTQGSAVQAEDNTVRLDLGLPSSHLFP